MFFIGVFGIEDKEKEIRFLSSLSCKGCNKLSSGRLIKRFTYFHFFFIPLFKWNEEYFVICNSCNSIFTISKEKGKEIERGEDIYITYWDLKEQGSFYGNYSSSVRRCTKCNRALDKNFEFCPYCGERIK